MITRVLSNTLIEFLTGTPRLAIVEDMSTIIDDGICKSSMWNQMMRVYAHRSQDGSLNLPFHSSRNISALQTWIPEHINDIELNEVEQNIINSFLNGQVPDASNDDVLDTLKRIGVSIQSQVALHQNDNVFVMERLIHGNSWGADQWMLETLGDIFGILNIDPHNFSPSDLSRVFEHSTNALNVPQHIKGVERDLFYQILNVRRKELRHVLILAGRGQANINMLTNDIIGDTMRETLVEAKLAIDPEPLTPEFEREIQLYKVL
jgi:hypothetical protein